MILLKSTHRISRVDSCFKFLNFRKLFSLNSLDGDKMRFWFALYIAYIASPCDTVYACAFRLWQTQVPPCNSDYAKLAVPTLHSSEHSTLEVTNPARVYEQFEIWLGCVQIAASVSLVLYLLDASVFVGFLLGLLTFMVIDFFGYKLHRKCVHKLSRLLSCHFWREGNLIENGS